MEVSSSAVSAGSARADVGHIAQLAASLGATVRERGKARAEIARLRTTYLGLWASARDERQKALR
eukprot:5665271-Alexandrium_andersonii.AAC.1